MNEAYLKEIAQLEARRRQMLSWCSNSGSAAPTPSSMRSSSPVPSSASLTSVSSRGTGNGHIAPGQEHAPCHEQYAGNMTLCVLMQNEVEVREGGQVYVNGKFLSDSAVEQRLRRLVAIKKSGLCEAGEDARKMFQAGGDERANLMELFKQSGLKKDQCGIMGWLNRGLWRLHECIAQRRTC